MSSETPPENMSVKELREWLKKVGKQNQDHFQQNQIKRRSPSKNRQNIERSSGFSTVRDRLSQFDPKSNVEEQENDRPGLPTFSRAPTPIMTMTMTSENQRPSNQVNRREYPMMSVNNHDDSFQLQDLPFKLDASPNLFSNVPPKSNGVAFVEESPSGSFVEQESSDLSEAPSMEVQDDLGLTLSAVSMASSSESFSTEANVMEVQPVESFNTAKTIEQLQSEPERAHKTAEEIAVRLQKSRMTNIQKKLKMAVGSIKESTSVAKDSTMQIDPPISKSMKVKPTQLFATKSSTKSKRSSKNPFRRQQIKSSDAQSVFRPFPIQQQVQIQRKAVPAAWSDLEQIDFSASGNSSNDEEKDKGDFDNTWKMWGDGDARQYLHRQSLPEFQGYWSDNECDEGDDDDSVATGLCSLPSRLRSKNAARRKPRHKSRRNTLSGLETPTIFEEEPMSGLTLFGAATASMSGNKSTASRTPSLSEFLVSTRTSSTAKKAAAMVPPARQSTGMHNANLFQDKTLTSGALDAICKTGEKCTELPRGALDTFFERFDHGTVCSWSEDSGKPSIAPNAVDANLSKVLSHDTDITYPTVESFEKRQSSDPYCVSKDMRQEPPSPPASPAASEKSNSDLAVDMVQTEKQAKSSPGTTPSTSSSFSSVLKKFGGGKHGRKTRIEKQKEALEQQWQANRKVKHVRKSKWQGVGGSGIYKRKIVVDVEDK